MTTVLLGAVFFVIAAVAAIILMPLVFQDPRSGKTKLCVAVLLITLALAFLSMHFALF